MELLSFRNYYQGVGVASTITKIFGQATINQLALNAVKNCLLSSRISLNFVRSFSSVGFRVDLNCLHSAYMDAVAAKEKGFAFLQSLVSAGSSTWARTRDLRINRNPGSSKTLINQRLTGKNSRRVIFRVIEPKL